MRTAEFRKHKAKRKRKLESTAYVFLRQFHEDVEITADSLLNKMLIEIIPKKSMPRSIHT
jgi:hypothetical protein